ncbi:MAG: type II secretion system protein [Planctomycetota bacterium]|nr:type II secretion system protein [Planctomycetota bacterium]
MSHSRKAFSLLELLLVIGVMFLLISIAVVAFSGVRASANRTASLNALRQMATGFNSYATDHRGRFMPGYLAESELELLTIKTEMPNGTSIDFSDCVSGDCDASSWVWRLSPYVGNAWDTFYLDYSDKNLKEKLSQHLEGSLPIYGPATASGTELPISEIPSFGMNSIFIGGDSAHGGGAITDKNPWTPIDADQVLAATRLSEILNPSRVILFGACMASPASPYSSGSEYNEIFGSAELRAPFLQFDSVGMGIGDPQWEIVEATGGLIAENGGNFDEGGGWPIDRWGGELVPVVHIDGSVVAEQRGRMANDGSLWSPKVISPARQQDTDGG